MNFLIYTIIALGLFGVVLDLITKFTKSKPKTPRKRYLAYVGRDGSIILREEGESAPIDYYAHVPHLDEPEIK